MKRFKNHFAICKHGNSRFKEKCRSIFVRILEVEEIHKLINTVDLLLLAILSYCFGFIKAIFISIAFEIISTGFLAYASYITEKRMRALNESERQLKSTFNRLNIKKEVKHES